MVYMRESEKRKIRLYGGMAEFGSLFADVILADGNTLLNCIYVCFQCQCSCAWFIKFTLDLMFVCVDIPLVPSILNKESVDSS
jgi:hypothetical protein